MLRQFHFLLGFGRQRGYLSGNTFYVCFIVFGKSILALIDTGKSHQHLQILGIRLVKRRFQLMEVGECLLFAQYETILQIERVFANIREIAGRQVVCLIAPIHRGVNLHMGGGIHGFSVAEHHFDWLLEFSFFVF
jgi:hypothetical protein